MLNDEVVKVIKNIRYLKKQSQISILCFIINLIENNQNKINFKLNSKIHIPEMNPNFGPVNTWDPSWVTQQAIPAVIFSLWESQMLLNAI